MNFHRLPFTGLAVGLLTLTCWAALAANTDVGEAHKPLGYDDETFVFMGRCPSGEAYRLLAYEKEVSGRKQSFYDYEGPAGKGTVKTRTAPRVIMSRVCLALAEIAGDE